MECSKCHATENCFTAEDETKCRACWMKVSIPNYDKVLADVIAHLATLDPGRLRASVSFDDPTGEAQKALDIDNAMIPHFLKWGHYWNQLFAEPAPALEPAVAEFVPPLRQDVSEKVRACALHGPQTTGGLCHTANSSGYSLYSPPCNGCEWGVRERDQGVWMTGFGGV
jgi:hypothetical protein